MRVAGMAVAVRMPAMGMAMLAGAATVMVVGSIAGGGGGAVRVGRGTHPRHCTQEGRKVQLRVVLIGHFDNWLRRIN